MDEVNSDPEVRLRKIIADMVERHFLRGMIGIAGKWSCEVCISEGVARIGGGGMQWPFERTAHFPLRDHASWLDIAWYFKSIVSSHIFR